MPSYKTKAINSGEDLASLAVRQLVEVQERQEPMMLHRREKIDSVENYEMAFIGRVNKREILLIEIETDKIIWSAGRLAFPREGCLSRRIYEEGKRGYDELNQKLKGVSL